VQVRRGQCFDASGGLDEGDMFGVADLEGVAAGRGSLHDSRPVLSTGSFLPLAKLLEPDSDVLLRLDRLYKEKEVSRG